MTVELREYQTALDAAIDVDMAAGVRAVLAVLPTGGGKSKIVSRRAQKYEAAGLKHVVMAHRQELVGQMSMHVAEAGVYHRIIGPKNVAAAIIAQHREEFNGHSFVNPTANCSVAGVDTLNARHAAMAEWAQQVSRWTIDEGHHVLRGNKWGNAVEMFPNAWGLGVTATPQRADGKGLGYHADGVYGSMVIGPTMRELITMRYLCDYEFVVPESDFNVDNLEITNAGDFNPAQLREASKASHIVGDIVKNYIIWAYGKRGITFVTDVETAIATAAKFNEYGIPAAAVSSETPDNVRTDYIKQFRAGKLWQLVNVDLFGEGFDVPAVEVVSMGRPTASLGVYLQQVGRALRLLFGKLRGLIIDHVSNFKRHGPPDKPHFWTLDARDRRVRRKPDPDLIELRCCTKCTKPYSPTLRACPYCGFAPVPLGGGRSVEEVDGDLMLLDAAALAKLREGLQLEPPASIGERVSAAAGGIAGQAAINHQMERIGEQTALKDAIAWWAAHERAKGRPDSETYRRFYLASGGIDVLSAQKLPRAEMVKLRELVESWYK